MPGPQAAHHLESNLWAMQRDFARIPGTTVHDDPDLLWYTTPGSNSWLNGASRCDLGSNAGERISQVVAAADDACALSLTSPARRETYGFAAEADWRIDDYAPVAGRGLEQLDDPGVGLRGGLFEETNAFKIDLSNAVVRA